MPIRTIRRIAGVLAGCWLLSFALPVVDAATPSGTDTWFGVMIFLTGWIAVFGYQFGWLANAVLPVVLLIASRERMGPTLRAVLVVCALALVALGVNAMAWDQIPTGYASNHLVRFRIGYYLWMGAMFGGAIWGLASATLFMSPVEE